jgi:GT2 family glycosyltransferase
MKISFVIVGINQWQKYTLPLIKSVLKNVEEADIVLVDNGSTQEYPTKRGVTRARLEETVCYSAALNAGIKACEPSDWYIITNNDVLVEKPLSMGTLDTHALYGFTKYKPGTAMIPFAYLSGWCYLISQHVLGTVGLFDEKFSPMWFEDADYCYRSVKAGIPLVELDRSEWGINHLESITMDERKAYMASHMVDRNRNRAYLKAKHGLK